MIRLQLGRKTLAVLILEDVFRGGETVIDCAYGVNVENIDMDTSFGTRLTLNTIEAKKLLKNLKELSNTVSLGLRTQMNNKIKEIQKQLKEEVADV